MKKILFLLFVISGFSTVKAQEAAKDSLPVYQRFPTIPPFKIMAAPDSVAFGKDDLRKKKPVVIVYFSPDCDHCKHFTKELEAHYDLFKNAQIVMASSLDFDLVKRFYQEYKIAEFSNIVVGRDGTDFFRNFLAVRSYPTIAVYNKKGDFIKRFDGTATMEKIAAALTGDVE